MTSRIINIIYSLKTYFNNNSLKLNDTGKNACDIIYNNLNVISRLKAGEYVDVHQCELFVINESYWQLLKSMMFEINYYKAIDIFHATLVRVSCMIADDLDEMPDEKNKIIELLKKCQIGMNHLKSTYENIYDGHKKALLNNQIESSINIINQLVKTNDFDHDNDESFEFVD